MRLRDETQSRRSLSAPNLGPSPPFRPRPHSAEGMKRAFAERRKGLPLRSRRGQCHLGGIASIREASEPASHPLPTRSSLPESGSVPCADLKLYLDAKAQSFQEPPSNMSPNIRAADA